MPTLREGGCDVLCERRPGLLESAPLYFPSYLDSGSLGAILARLRLRLWVTPSTTEGLEIKASISWKGGIDEHALRTLAESPRTLEWDATLAWKAFGRR